MPHIIVEYSDQGLNAQALIEALHHDVASHETVDIERIKSRAIHTPAVIVGGEDQSDLFIHITLKILPGRSESVQKSLAKSLRDIALRHSPSSIVTAEVQILSSNTYCA